MKNYELKITQKEFKHLGELAENIYNTLIVINYFVENQPNIEECYNLTPIIKNLLNDADILNAFFIEHEKFIED